MDFFYLEFGDMMILWPWCMLKHQTDHWLDVRTCENAAVWSGEDFPSKYCLCLFWSCMVWEASSALTLKVVRLTWRIGGMLVWRQVQIIRCFSAGCGNLVLLCLSLSICNIQLLAFHTTTTLSAQEIHDIGLEEVKRIRANMEQVFGFICIRITQWYLQDFSRCDTRQLSRGGGEKFNHILTLLCIQICPEELEVKEFILCWFVPPKPRNRLQSYPYFSTQNKKVWEQDNNQ